MQAQLFSGASTFSGGFIFSLYLQQTHLCTIRIGVVAPDITSKIDCCVTFAGITVVNKISFAKRIPATITSDILIRVFYTNIGVWKFTAQFGNGTCRCTPRGFEIDATRTPTITECRNVGYIKLSKGTYSPDTKGYQFVDACEKLGLTFTVKEVMDLSMMLFDVRKGTRTIDECVKTAMEKLNLMFTHKNAEVENLRPENTPICKCPKCGGNIIEWKESYSCSNKGCPAVVWKHSKVLEKINGKKKTFSKKDAITLFSGKPVSDKGCVSQKTGKTYDCLLYLDLTEEKAQMKITFDSAASTGKSVGVCPVCGKKMVERPNSFSCENSSCGFTIWKETKRFSDILKIDAEKAKQLLDGKGVPFELTNKKNEKYTTNLLLTVSVYNGKHYPKFDLPVKPPKKY